MDVNNQPDPDGKGNGAPGNVGLEEQNRGLMQGMMAEREKRHALEREVSEMKGKLESLGKQATQPTKTYTRTELDNLVDEGKLDKGQADQIFTDQLQSQVTQSVTDSVITAMTSKQRTDLVNTEIERYKQAIPEITQPGTAARQRVEQEFQFLTGLGDASDLATELKALRAVYGPVDKLQTSQPGAEPHREHGEDTAGDGDDGMRTDGIPKGLTQAQRNYYKPLIGRLYKDWKEVEAELKYANPRLTKRYANL